jgi:hypothetical protein
MSQNQRWLYDLMGFPADSMDVNGILMGFTMMRMGF